MNINSLLQIILIALLFLTFGFAYMMARFIQMRFEILELQHKVRKMKKGV